MNNETRGLVNKAVIHKIMTPLAEIKTRLEKYPDLEVSEDERSITVPSFKVKVHHTFQYTPLKVF
ncbi:hypothetical protein A3197_05580 [Candidatus Thiodiazotropha endoloripes]|nr:hypothetical protein A3197_05580 [Candidatus Thiodiazotropha endoloripes]